MDWRHPRGVMYLTTAWIECPTGEVLTSIRFEQKALKFRYAYACVYAGNVKMEYETIKNDLTAFRSEVDGKQGSINYLDRQSVRCPKNSGLSVFLLTAVGMELHNDADTLRYIYKCGNVHFSGDSMCGVRSTPKHQAKDFFLPTLEHLGIKCHHDEGLTKFQLRVEYNPVLLLWYEFTCCRQPYGFLERQLPSNSTFPFSFFSALY